MPDSTLTALSANPAPSPETGLISSVLYCPTFSSTVSTAAASATRLAWTSNFSSIVRHPSSVIRHQSSVIHRPSSNYSFLFVSRLFFTQK
jgi:hypothetical protein